MSLDINQVLYTAEHTTFSKISHKERNVKWIIIKASFNASRSLGFGNFKSIRAVFHLSRTHSKNFSKAKPTSNVKDAIEILSSFGIKLAILSYSSRKKIDLFLQKYLEGNRFFESEDILTSGEFGKHKKDGIDYFIKKFGFEASMCGIVGDLGGDILTGKSVGLKTFGVTTGYTNQKILDIASPDNIFENLLDLANYLVEEEGE